MQRLPVLSCPFLSYHTHSLLCLTISFRVLGLAWHVMTIHFVMNSGWSPSPSQRNRERKKRERETEREKGATTKGKGKGKGKLRLRLGPLLLGCLCLCGLQAAPHSHSMLISLFGNQIGLGQAHSIQFNSNRIKSNAQPSTKAGDRHRLSIIIRKAFQVGQIEAMAVPVSTNGHRWTHLHLMDSNQLISIYLSIQHE